ncbi:hypothetical protein WG622_17990 [Cognatishimia sp. D5M38]|uniref:Uncharacterized protein n=1 Tax=Cognatishimia coralii TaxID=3083254 RepID=A0ABU8QL65_9RHOB
MAGQKGAFENALAEIDNTKSKSVRETKPKPAPKPSTNVEQKEAPKAAPRKAVASSSEDSASGKRRKKKRATKTVPFSQRVDNDVVNYFYDIANQEDWTMNSTLRRAAKALAESRGDNLSMKVKDEL